MSRFAAVDGGTGGDGFDAELARAKHADWKSIADHKAEAERARREALVAQVAEQLLHCPIPVADDAALYAWATDRARNVLAGLQGVSL